MLLTVFISIFTCDQVLRLVAGARLLLAAPSNSAADLLAQRLLASGAQRSRLLRVHAYQRPYSDVAAADLMDCSNWSASENAFLLPEAPAICSKQVVVTTCLMAAKLVAAGVPCGNFTHIFIDEAGYAEEPLGLAALAGLAGGTAQVCCVVVCLRGMRALAVVVAWFCHHCHRLLCASFIACRGHTFIHSSLSTWLRAPCLRRATCRCIALLCSAPPCPLLRRWC